jgi:hypothetical protein
MYHIWILICIKNYKFGVCVKGLYFTNLMWWEIVIVEVCTAVTWVVSCMSVWGLAVETHVSSQDSHCGTGGQVGVWTGFVWSASVFPCQCHSPNVPHSFIHLSPRLLTSPLNNALYKLWEFCTVVDH